MRSRYLNTKFTLGDCLFMAVKLTENADPEKYGYSGYGIRFNTSLNFSVNDKQGKNVTIFSVDNSLSLHTDNRKDDIIVLGEGSAGGLDDTTITVQAKYSVSITKFRKKILQVYTKMQPTVFLYANSSISAVLIKIFQKTLQSIT